MLSLCFSFTPGGRGRFVVVFEMPASSHIGRRAAQCVLSESQV